MLLWTTWSWWVHDRAHTHNVQPCNKTYYMGTTFRWRQNAWCNRYGSWVMRVMSQYESTDHMGHGPWVTKDDPMSSLRYSPHTWHVRNVKIVWSVVTSDLTHFLYSQHYEAFWLRPLSWNVLRELLWRQFILGFLQVSVLSRGRRETDKQTDRQMDWQSQI